VGKAKSSVEPLSDPNTGLRNYCSVPTTSCQRLLIFASHRLPFIDQIMTTVKLNIGQLNSLKEAACATVVDANIEFSDVDKAYIRVSQDFFDISSRSQFADRV
jgi:hypothetical protein